VNDGCTYYYLKSQKMSLDFGQEILYINNGQELCERVIFRKQVGKSIVDDNQFVPLFHLKGNKMSTTIYCKPEYTSMECIRESDDWGFSDEVYAIFVGVDWTNSITQPRLFVRRTYVYGDIDAGEKKGANKSWDNKNLTKSGKYNYTNPDKQIVLVQAMEHDNSSAWAIRRILYTVMEKCVDKLLVVYGGNRSTMISNTKSLMKEVI
jgi:hypothetical protein